MWLLCDLFALFTRISQIRFPGTRFSRWLFSNPEWYAFTVDCRYNTVQFITISLSALRWQQLNANQTSKSQQAPQSSPSRASNGVSTGRIGEKTVIRHRNIYRYINCVLAKPQQKNVQNVCIILRMCRVSFISLYIVSYHGNTLVSTRLPPYRGSIMRIFNYSYVVNMIKLLIKY